MIEAEAKCQRLAARRRGVLSRHEALSAGMSAETIRRRAKSGQWEELFPGVYAMPGAPRSWEQRLVAACAWGGKGVVASHRSAAALFGFPRFQPGLIEITTTRGTRPPPGLSVHRVRWLPKDDLAELRGIPVTDAARTLIDLGAVVSVGEVRAAVEDALRRRLTAVPLLEGVLELRARSGRRGAGALRQIIGELAPGYRPTESELENRLREVLEEAGLPAAQQHEVVSAGRRHRLDFAYPSLRLALEADSKRHHMLSSDWERDLERRNALTRNGWRLLHFSWDAVTRRSGSLVAAIRQAMSVCRAEMAAGQARRLR